MQKNSTVIARGKGALEEGEEGEREQVEMEGDLIWDSKHMIQYTGDILYNRILETYPIS